MIIQARSRIVDKTINNFNNTRGGECHRIHEILFTQVEISRRFELCSFTKKYKKSLVGAFARAVSAENLADM